MSNKKTLHLRTNVKDNKPSSAILDHGAIAINYHKESPTMFIKDSEDNVVEFKDKNYFENIITENELVVATALTTIKDNVGLNDTGDYIPKEGGITEGATSVSNAIELLDDEIISLNDDIDNLTDKVDDLEYILDSKQDVISDLSTIRSNAEKGVIAFDELDNKANTTGYYEGLEVGLADNLIGRDIATDREFAFSPSGGEGKSIQDGTARITNIYGSSLVWNQLINNIVSNDLGTTGWYIRQGSDKAVISGNKITITFTSGVSDFPVLSQRLSLKSNRKYYIKITYEVPKLDQYNRSLQVSLDSAYSASGDYEVITELNGYNNTKSTVSTICNGLDEKPYLIIRPRNYTNDVGETMSCEVEVIDITKMFGSGNEPTTVEEFNARCPQNVSLEYNEGTIINNNTTAIKTTGFNAWDEEWELGGIGIKSGSIFSNSERIRSKNYCKCLPNTEYYVQSPTEAAINILWYDNNKNFIVYNYCNRTRNIISPTNACYFKINTYADYGTTYNNDICINLSHTGYRNGEYKPYESFTRQLPTVEGGLKSAGSVCDEIKYNQTTRKWEYIQRVGQVDLGELEWQFLEGTATSNNRFISLSGLSNVKSPAYSEQPNVLCAKYNRISPYRFYEVLSADLGVGIGQNSTKVILLDKQYNDDVVALKASLQGVILYYELAEPIITELDYDRGDIEYNVWDFGTEEAIQEVPSTLFKSSIKYGFNAVDTIRWNEIEIENLKDKIKNINNNSESASTLIKVSYNELVSLRNNANLIPGCWYRITDYVTTTSQENTMSAGHQFDVLVLATDVNVLSEEARAINHEEEVDPNKPIRYGSEYVGASEYDNLYLFEATGESVVAQSGITYWKLKGYYVDNGNIVEAPSELMFVTTSNPPVIGEPVYMGSTLEEALEATFLNIGEPIAENTDYFENCNLNAWKIWYCLDNDESRFAWADSKNGSGVIYRMIDEWNNDCPYDFKNIMFTLPEIGGYGGDNGGGPTGFSIGEFDEQSEPIEESDETMVELLDASEQTYYYTFTTKENGYGVTGIYDMSVIDNKCYDNKMGMYIIDYIQSLNCNVFVNKYYTDNCYSNSFGDNCHSNLFGEHCYSNSFGNSCTSNTFGNNCYSNSFGKDCYSNSFGNTCYSNSFGNSCTSNTFGNTCHTHSFGTDCNYNSFGNTCYSNSFGEHCNSNSFGNTCTSNTFGNYCTSNTFSTNCAYNSFGNNCYSNSFGKDCYSNSFGNTCYSNSFSNYCKCNSFGDTCYSNTFSTNCTYNSFGNGCNYNSFGTDCAYNLFGGTCYSNSFVEHCKYNSFGNGCDYNSFGSGCNSNSFGNSCTSNSFGKYCNSNTFGDGCDYNSFSMNNTNSAEKRSYCHNNIFENGVACVNLYNISTASNTNKLQNIIVCQGMSGTYGNNNIVEIPTLNNEYQIKVAKNTAGDIKVYCEADLIN